MSGNSQAYLNKKIMSANSQMLIELREKEQTFDEFIKELEKTENLIYMRNGK